MFNLRSIQKKKKATCKESQTYFTTTNIWHQASRINIYNEVHSKGLINVILLKFGTRAWYSNLWAAELWLFHLVLQTILLLGKQRLILKDQHLSWIDVTAGTLQGSSLGSLHFLTYIHDLSYGLRSNPKHIVENTFLLSDFKDIHLSQNGLN